MDVRFIHNLSHRDSANEYESNGNCSVANGVDDEITYYKRKIKQLKI